MSNDDDKGEHPGLFSEFDPTPTDPPPDVLDAVEVVDGDAEALVFGANQGDPSEVTPTLVAGCFECNGAISQVGEWRPPAGPDEAWRYWREGCVVSVGSRDVWTFCPVTGVARINGVRKDFERRKEKHEPRPRPWDGTERRKANR